MPLAAEVIEKLMSYDYPGNVRELRNILERAVILAAGSLITVDHIITEQDEELSEILNDSDKPENKEVYDNLLNRRRAQLDERQVIEALNKTNGHRKKAADMLGVSERTLYRYVQQIKTK